MNVHTLGEEYAKDLHNRRKISIAMLKSFIELAELVMASGGDVSFEWPNSSRGWTIPELLSFIVKHDLWTCHVDGCSLGMTNDKGEPILKRWRFVTSNPRLHAALKTYSCSHPKGFRHGEIEGGSFTRSTAGYPLALCRTYLAGMFGYYECTPCVPVVVSTGQGHREKDDESGRVPVECACAHPDMSSSSSVSMRIPSYVHKLLSWKETRYNPEAIEAVRAEVSSLAELGTWDVANVMEKDDLIAWAQTQKTKVIVGEGLGICSIKNSELPSSDPRRKHKGRFCYRAPTARDEGGALAIYQEMASRPTTVVDFNLAIAYGMIAGNRCTISDAIKAYVQSLLAVKTPTYIEIPKHLCPKEWAHMRRPVCRLIRALYGHPEAGGHWEKHLALIVESIGGTVVQNHPSCFWFAELKLLLIIYVDDLLLSGPAEAHVPFWERLGKLVNLDPHEDLDRYLGRHHQFEFCDSSEYDLKEFFQSPIQT